MNKDINEIHELNLEKIKKVFPDEIKSCEFYKEGCDSYAYNINQKWVFKIPKRDGVWEMLVKERDFLNYFRNTARSYVGVPNFIFFQYEIVGYEKINGEKLTYDLFTKLDKDDQNVIVYQLANFLKELHNTDYKIENKSEYRNFFNKEGLLKLIVEIEKIVFPNITDHIRNNINIFLEKFLNNEKNFINKKATTHADLHPGNLLWDDKMKKISILDFGEIVYDAVVKDFSLSLFDFSDIKNDKFLDMILEIYGSEDDDLYRKIKEFSNIEKLYLVIDSFYNENENDFEQSINAVVECFDSDVD